MNNFYNSIDNKYIDTSKTQEIKMITTSNNHSCDKYLSITFNNFITNNTNISNIMMINYDINNIICNYINTVMHGFYFDRSYYNDKENTNIWYYDYDYDYDYDIFINDVKSDINNDYINISMSSCSNNNFFTLQTQFFGNQRLFVLIVALIGVVVIATLKQCILVHLFGTRLIFLQIFIATTVLDLVAISCVVIVICQAITTVICIVGIAIHALKIIMMQLFMNIWIVVLKAI